MAIDPKMAVLVVDDSSLMAGIVEGFLKQMGFCKIDRAVDGGSALAMMNVRRYDLVISDWNMQPKTGYTLLRRMRDDPATKTTPFIMMTTESKAEYIDAAKRAGVTDYIVKPFTAQVLKAKIDQIFATRLESTSF